MLAHPQHIKCLEAFMLALHLTNRLAFAGVHPQSRAVQPKFESSETATANDLRCSLATLVAQPLIGGAGLARRLDGTRGTLHSAALA